MAIRQYNASPTTRAAGTSAEALERLRNFEIVERYTGASLTNSTSFLTGNTHELTSAVNINTVGHHAFIGKTIYIDDGGSINATANGVHLYFFNCNIIIRRDSSHQGNRGALAVNLAITGTADSRISQGAASTRSVNFYGCSYNIFPVVNRAAQWWMFSDFFNSTFNCSSRVSIPIPSVIQGSRVINATLNGANARTNLLSLYGAPDIFEGVVLGNMAQELTQAAVQILGNTGGTAGPHRGALVQVEPNFISTNLQQRYRTQGGGAGNKYVFQSIGSFMPFDNGRSTTITSADTGRAYVRFNGSNRGGVINYYGWEPTFHSNVARTSGIPGVRTRVSSNMVLSNTTGLPTSTDPSADISNKSTTTTDLTARPLNFINEFVSDANGLPVASDAMRSSVDGSTFVDSRLIDWLALGVRTLTASQDHTAENLYGFLAPNGVLIAPIQDITDSAYNQYSVRLQSRSYSNLIDLDTRQNGVLGTDPGNQMANSLVPIEDVQLVADTRGNVQTEAEALARFATTATPGSQTIEQVFEGALAQWARFSFDMLPTVSGSVLNFGTDDVIFSSTAGDIEFVQGGGGQRFSHTWGYSGSFDLLTDFRVRSDGRIFISRQNDNSADVSADLAQIEVGDTIEIASSSAGFTDQSFTVTAVSIEGQGDAVVTIDGTLNTAGLIGFVSTVTITDSAPVTAQNFTINSTTDLVSDTGALTQILTGGDVTLPGSAVNTNINADNILGLPSSGLIIGDNGVATGNIELAPGNYTINGDASGVVFSRSGSTGTATLAFGPNATRPTAPLGNGVEAPFVLTIAGRTDNEGRLSVYKNGVLEPYVDPMDVSPATFEATGVGAGTDEFVVVYTAPGRTDFRFPDTGSFTLNVDQPVTVTSEANPFPTIPLTGNNRIDPDDIIGPTAATFTANPEMPEGRGIITILNDTEWTKGSSVTNYGVQRLVKGKEVYNNIIRLSGQKDLVFSLGGNSSARVNGTFINFAASSPQSVGYIEPAGDTLSTLTEGRFFTPDATQRFSATWAWESTGGNVPISGQFNIAGSSGVQRSTFVVNDIDGDGTNRGTGLGGVLAGDYLTITDTTDMSLVGQYVVGSEVDVNNPAYHQFTLATDPEISTLVDGRRYIIAVTDAPASTISVGVTIGRLTSFDPGVTASQIASSVGQDSDVANSLRFIRQGFNSRIPAGRRYDDGTTY